jgi:O-acetyl-ADP-ribose deacetylase (regulator of RNase III)/uncharacterized protein YwgA
MIGIISEGSIAMIEYRHGNLLEADVEALVNTVNCVGIMGKGIALQFRQRFPENFRLYEHATRAGDVQLGRMFVVSTRTLTNPRYIINFPTKHHWREQSRLEHIKTGLDSLIIEVHERHIGSIAVPPLGCGNGGLNWADVRPLIEQAFHSLPDVQVFVYEPQSAPVAGVMPVATPRPHLTRARALLLRLMDLYRLPGARLNKLEIQKLAYLLQASGEPLRLNYQRQQFGPYADNLNHVLLRLEGHYIRGYGDRTNNSEIHLMPEAAAEAQAFLLGDQEAQARLDRVHRLIKGFENPAGMELLTTILWVNEEDPRAASDVRVAIAGVQEWSPRKRQKFSEQQIKSAWEQLRAEHWLLPPTAAHDERMMLPEEPVRESESVE